MTKYEVAAHESEKHTIDGKAGDQTGHEVSVSAYRNFSEGGYDLCMRYYGKRPKTVRNRIVQAGVRLAKTNRVGYSQKTRNGLYNQMQALKWYLRNCKRIKKCNTDCSSFVGVVVNIALVPLKLATTIPPDIFTGTEYDYLKARGFERVNVDFATGKGMLPGDILINIANHTTVIIGNRPDGQIIASTTKKDSVENVARDVIQGYWGDGKERREALKAAGYDPDEVQRKVNKMLALDGC